MHILIRIHALFQVIYECLFDQLLHFSDTTSQKMIEVITNIFGSSIGKIFLIDIGIQWVGWAFAVAFKTEKFYDLTGEFSYYLLRKYLLR